MSTEDLNLIDSHAHLHSDAFDSDRDEAIQRARAAGVTRIITIGAGGQDPANKAVALAEKFPGIWASVGVHPHDAGETIFFSEIERLAASPRVVAIGETGLDFFRDWSPIPKQYEFFRLQIALARAVKKPLVIHCRNAAKECLDVLKEERAQDVGGVFHCFSEDAMFAKELLDLNFSVSFPGIVTFKKAVSVHEACKAIPLSQILVETDSPYLAPEPFRGKRAEPAHVVKTAEYIAMLKGLPLAEIAKTTCDNTIKLFPALNAEVLA